MRRHWMLLNLALLMVMAPAVYAIDHKNLDEGRPLRLDDAYAIASGELAVEAGAGFALERRGPDRGVFPLEVLYGAYPNLQLGLGTTLLTDPRDIDEQTKSGDLRVSGLYNFNQETLTLPAFGLKLELNLPTGADSAGVDVEVKGIVTRSIDRLSLHLNAGYEFLSGTTRDERDGPMRSPWGRATRWARRSTPAPRSSGTCSPSRGLGAAARTSSAPRSASATS
jgi:hypothetical protein